MKCWVLDDQTGHDSDGARRARCSSGLVGAIGHGDFATRALAALNERVAAASWSVYQVWRDRPPVLHLSGSLGVPDTTGRCFAAYRDGLYRRDRSFDAVKSASGPGRVALLRMHADEAPNRDHRDIIYRRHGIVERLSLVRAVPDDSLLAINLYHHAHQGDFGDGEVQGLAEIAPLLLASVQRQLDWAAQPPSTPAADAARHPATDRRAALAARCPALTPRELDVCERLLRGMSYDGIAADLGLSLASVKTYRARAFERLGLHFKSELFADFLAPH